MGQCTLAMLEPCEWRELTLGPASGNRSHVLDTWTWEVLQRIPESVGVALGRGWEKFEEQDRKSPECLDLTVDRNTDVKGLLVRAREEVGRTAEDTRVHLCLWSPQPARSWCSRELR